MRSKRSRAFSKAAALDPTHPDAQLNLANAYLSLASRAEAIHEAGEIVKVDPSSAAAHYVLGCAYLRLSRFEEAVKELQTAKDIDQKVNAVSFQLGRAYQGWGKFEEAAEQFREVIQFEEHTPPITWPRTTTSARSWSAWAKRIRPTRF